MTGELLRVGEMAARSGVTVRTLHHYEEIGLLIPSHRSPAGHRLYAAADVERLHRIRSLRQLGFSLEEIRECLDRPGFSLRRVIEMHKERLEDELEVTRKLRDRLDGLARTLDSAESATVDDLMRTMEMMDRLEKYYTPKQLRKLQQRREQIGEDRIREAEGEWSELIGLVRAEMERGAEPSSPEVQALARRWMGLIREFTGGDPGIARSLGNAVRGEGNLDRRFRSFSTREMMHYISRASAAMKGGGEDGE